MGLMCDKNDWDKNKRKCKTAWQKWPSKGPRADINEILTHLIILPSSSTNLVRDSSNKPVSALEWVEKIDLEKTATNLFNQATNQHGGKPPERVAFEFCETDTDDWAKHSEDIGKLIQEVGKDNWSRHRNLFETSRSGIELVIRARQGDNSKFQVKDMKKALGWDPTTKEIDNPRNPSTPWKVVDFKQTIADRAAATDQSKEDVAKGLSKAAKNVYARRVPKEHKVVIDGNRRALERVNHCIS